MVPHTVHVLGLSMQRAEVGAAVPPRLLDQVSALREQAGGLGALWGRGGGEEKDGGKETKIGGVRRKWINGGK